MDKDSLIVMDSKDMYMQYGILKGYPYAVRITLFGGPAPL